MKTTGTVRQGGQDAGDQKDEHLFTDDRLNESAAQSDENASDQKEELPWPDDRLRELVFEAKTGDKDAVDRLLEYPRVKKMIRVICVGQLRGWKTRGERDIDDFEQEFRILIWLGISGFTGESQKILVNWLGKVARNQNISLHRKVKSEDRNRVDIEGIKEPECGGWQSPFNNALIAEWREKLTDRERLIVDLHVQGEPFKAIGERLPDGPEGKGKSSSQVEREWKKAFRKMEPMVCPLSKSKDSDSTHRVKRKSIQPKRKESHGREK